MTIWYVDCEAGTNSNSGVGAGDSFATRRKYIYNITAASLTPGDTIRVMASVDPVNTGINGTWASGSYGTAITPASSSNTTPIVVTKAGHGLVTGDVVFISGHTTNTQANGLWYVTVSGNDFTLFHADGSNSVGNGTGSATGTFTKITSQIVTLSSSTVTKPIAVTGNYKTNWTQSANVTCAVDAGASYSGYGSQKIIVAAGFTTGLAAYYPTGALDLSGYKQVSFEVFMDSGNNIAAGDMQLKLCSDASGATPVNTINFPSVPTAGSWQHVTVDTGGALDSNINSIALYVVTDNAAQTFYLDNIIACKDSTSNDALTLTSLIGKSGANTDWYPIIGIDGNKIKLSCNYYGTAENAALYRQETIKTPVIGSSANSAQYFNEAGTSGARNLLSGGWDRAAMSSQTGVTILDGSNYQGRGIYFNNYSYWDCEGFDMVRYGYGFYLNSDWCSIDSINSITNQVSFYVSGIYNQLTLTNSIGCYKCLNAYSSNFNNLTVTNILGSSEATINLSLSYNNKINVTGQFKGNNYTTNSYGVYIDEGGYNKIYANELSYYPVGVFFNSIGNKIYNSDISLCSSPANAGVSSDYFSENYLINCTSSSSFSISTSVEKTSTIKYDDGLNTGFSTISKNYSVLHNSTGMSWKLSPTNSTYINTTSPLELPVARVGLSAGYLVTATLWMRRDNTGLTSSFCVKHGEIPGEIADIQTAMTAIADTWEQLTITFTPVSACVVEFIARCYGGTTYSLYVQDFDVSQA